jgi:hypothetical protein
MKDNLSKYSEKYFIETIEKIKEDLKSVGLTEFTIQLRIFDFINNKNDIRKPKLNKIKPFLTSVSEGLALISKTDCKL